MRLYACHHVWRLCVQTNIISGLHHSFRNYDNVALRELQETFFNVTGIHTSVNSLRADDVGGIG